MRSLLFFTAASMLAASLSIGAPTAAGANEPPAVVPLVAEESPDLVSYLATLDSDAAAEFVATMMPSTLQLTEGEQLPTDAAARASAQVAQSRGTAVTDTTLGCWSKRVDGTAHAAAGNALYSLYHAGSWCADGSRVTSAAVADRGGQIYTVGWRYEGAVGGAAGVIDNQGRSYSQLKFVLGTGGWDIQTALPCLRVRGTIGGGSASESICGLY